MTSSVRVSDVGVGVGGGIMVPDGVSARVSESDTEDSIDSVAEAPGLVVDVSLWVSDDVARAVAVSGTVRDDEAVGVWRCVRVRVISLVRVRV